MKRLRAVPNVLQPPLGYSGRPRSPAHSAVRWSPRSIELTGDTLIEIVHSDGQVVRYYFPDAATADQAFENLTPPNHYIVGAWVGGEYFNAFVRGWYPFEWVV